MTHKNNPYKIDNPYDRTKHAKITVDENGIAYRSGVEARFARTAELNNLHLLHEIASFLKVFRGQYSPDYFWLLPDDRYGVIEVKGWWGDEVVICANDFIDGLGKDTPSDIAPDFYAVVTAQDMFGWVYNAEHNTVLKYDFGIFVCPSCGEGLFVPISKPECPFCGEMCDSRLQKDGGDLVCTNANKWYNDWSWKHRKAAKDEKKRKLKEQKAIEAKDIKHEERVAQRLEEIRRAYPKFGLEPGRPIEKDKNGLCFLSYYEPTKGEYIPDYWYTEPRSDVKTFGTAFDPTVVVSICENPDANDSGIFDEIADDVCDKDSIISKHVILTHNSIRVCDGAHGKQYEEGDVYECQDEKCRKPFFAVKGREQCPCCKSRNTKSINGRSKG